MASLRKQLSKGTVKAPVRGASHASGPPTNNNNNNGSSGSSSNSKRISHDVSTSRAIGSGCTLTLTQNSSATAAAAGSAPTPRTPALTQDGPMSAMDQIIACKGGSTEENTRKHQEQDVQHWLEWYGAERECLGRVP